MLSCSQSLFKYMAMNNLVVYLSMFIIMEVDIFITVVHMFVLPFYFIKESICAFCSDNFVKLVSIWTVVKCVHRVRMDVNL